MIENATAVQHLRNAYEAAQRVSGRYPEDKDAELLVALLEAVESNITVQKRPITGKE